MCIRDSAAAARTRRTCSSTSRATRGSSPRCSAGNWAASPTRRRRRRATRSPRSSARSRRSATARTRSASASRPRAHRSRTSPRRASRASSRTSTSTSNARRPAPFFLFLFPRSKPPLLVGLEAALLDVNADVDGCLRSYGEDPKTTDFQAWIDDILGFVDAYGKEFEDREEAKLRERRRRELESKKRARAAALGAAEPGGAARRPSRRPSQQRDSQSGADFTSFLRNVRAGAVLEAEDRGDLSDDGWSDDDDEGRSPGGQLTPKDTS